jgi:hypothetical protein
VPQSRDQHPNSDKHEDMVSQAFGAASLVLVHGRTPVWTLDLKVQSMLDMVPKKGIQHERQTAINVPTRCHGEGQCQGIQAMTP